MPGRPTAVQQAVQHPDYGTQLAKEGLSGQVVSAWAWVRDVRDLGQFRMIAALTLDDAAPYRLTLVTPQTAAEIRQMLAEAEDQLLWMVARVSSEVGLDENCEPFRASIGVLSRDARNRRRRRPRPATA